MKNLFSTIMNNSLFKFAKRVVVLYVFLSISTAAAASSSDKFAKLTANVHPQSTGSGCVYVTENKNSSIEVCEKGLDSEMTSTGRNSGSTYTFTYTLTAKSEAGSYVAGWTRSSSSLENLEGSTTHTVQLKGTTDNGENIVSETWYAVFKPIVGLPEPNKVSIKVIGDESSPTMVKLPEVVNTTQLTLSITGDNEQNEWFQ